jgi:hypothetical protein
LARLVARHVLEEAPRGVPQMPGSSMEASAGRSGRVVRLVAGWTLVVSGAALLVLPGPGIPLVLGGLALLAREQAWAGRVQRKILVRWARARRRYGPRRASRKTPRRGQGPAPDARR